MKKKGNNSTLMNPSLFSSGHSPPLELEHNKGKEQEVVERESLSYTNSRCTRT